jgi:alkanesulfonate monooxygenase SsuD/methylene tetrahydromethanopterin reductase-like flavin-dependent oxidoreductase (luciferase family)
LRLQASTFEEPPHAGADRGEEPGDLLVAGRRGRMKAQQTRLALGEHPVEQHADWWNYGFRDTALYTHKQDVLKAHCREVGRDYDRIVQVIRVGILIAETDREVERLKTAPGVRPMADIRLAGTPAHVTDALQAIIKQGAGRLTVNFADAPRPDGTLLFAEQVLPNL